MASSEHNSSLSYRRIRAPQDHGSTLLLPEAQNWPELWKRNQDLASATARCEFCDFKELLQSGREEIVSAAVKYSQAYRSVDDSNRDRQLVVMSGHQPTLFHPGVWFKNFVLAKLGEVTGSFAINLVVDSDNCVLPTSSAPTPHSNGMLGLSTLAYDSSSNPVPFEERKILDRDRFQKFGEWGSSKIQNLIQAPLLARLWPHVLSSSAHQNIGLAIAQGRHKLEAELGLQTLELPVSTMANSMAFTRFAREILGRITDFQKIYNETTNQYRQIHRIRNATRPVPDLICRGDWQETPFWIWTTDRPVRQSLFAKINADTLSISDQNAIEQHIHLGCSDAEFHEFLTSKICVRPKALMTTLFSRLIVSQLFIHGIGGAKYDQLTDEICRRFFETKMPDYLTVSATFLIQPERQASHLRENITELKARRRKIKFHPERYLENPTSEAKELIAEKTRLIRQQLPWGQRLARHQGIERCNQRLQPFLSEYKEKLEARINELIEQDRASSVLASREFSFCFFDDSLIAEMLELASQSVGFLETNLR